MKPDKTIEQRLEQLADKIASRDSFVNDVLTRIESSPVQRGTGVLPVKHGQDGHATKKKPNHVLRRILMKTPVKLTVAAIVAIAAILSLTIFESTTSKLYALEETVDALHSVRTIHIREYHYENQEPILIWAEFLPDGQTRQMRLSLPEWNAPLDGAKEILWKDNKAQVWFKKKNSLLIVTETKLAEQIKSGMEKADPKWLLEKLLWMQQQGTAQLTIEHTSDMAEPIVATAVFSEADPLLGKRVIITVDQATRLLLSLELSVFDDGREKMIRMEYFDYNQKFADDVFCLNPPEDVTVVDQTATSVGLNPSDLTDDEAAIETVRRFWQAVIDRDFETAGKLMEGLPPQVIQNVIDENLPNSHPLEIVSVGPVHPHPDPATRGVIVPCTIKINRDGRIIEQTFDTIGVRQVYNQPDRWTIFGGL